MQEITFTRAINDVYTCSPVRLQLLTENYRDVTTLDLRRAVEERTGCKYSNVNRIALLIIAASEHLERVHDGQWPVALWSANYILGLAEEMEADDDGWKRVPVVVPEGDSAWNPGTHKHVIYGPTNLVYDIHPSGVMVKHI